MKFVITTNKKWVKLTVDGRLAWLSMFVVGGYPFLDWLSVNSRPVSTRAGFPKPRLHPFTPLLGWLQKNGWLQKK